MTDGVVIVAVFIVDAHKRRAFRNAVATGQRNADIPEKFTDLRADRRAAADDLAQPSAKEHMQLAEQLRPQINAEFQRSAGKLHALFKGFELILLFEVAHDIGIDKFRNGRHHINIGRMIQLHILDKILHHRIDTDRCMKMNVDQNITNRLIGVVIRQNGKPGIINLGNLKTIVYAAAKIVLGKHNTLCNARCAGGIHQHFQLLRVAVQGIICRFIKHLALLQKLLIRKNQLVVLFGIKADIAFHARHFFMILTHPLRLPAADQNNLAFAVVHQKNLVISR